MKVYGSIWRNIKYIRTGANVAVDAFGGGGVAVAGLAFEVVASGSAV